MINWELLKPIDSEQNAQAEAERQEAVIYLRSTDWYVIRTIETGKAIPPEVSALRAQARLKL